TYNDPTKKRGPPKGKLVPMMTGYIEAIEARLHRMEGLLGGLVKDKDPRAEIVRAELDAMAREAEMTGLKLRRSKAYEEINHAMGSSSSSSKDAGSASVSAPPASSSRVPNQHISQQQQPQQQQQSQQQQHPHPHQFQHQQHRQSLPGSHASHNRPGPQQSTSTYGSHVNTASLSDTNPHQGSTPGRSQPLLQPSPTPPASRSQYQPYEHARHPQQPHTHQRPQPTPQRHHSQSNQGTNPPYSKQHQPPSHQSQVQHEQQPQPQYDSSYGNPGFSSTNQHSNYGDRRVSLNHQRSDSHAGQSHHQNQALRESDHHRGSSGFSASGNGSSLDMGYRHYNNAGNGYPMDSHRMVTHRPSLTAHHLSNSLTGYMRIPESVNKDEALIMPSIDVIDHLLDVHFRFIHPVLPMLHFRAISDQIHRKESPPSHLLFAVLGLAARFSDNSAFRVPQAGIELPPCAIFYERAKYFIKDEYDNSQIATVQALLLMAVQQMGFCESQRAWLYVGMAIRMAQDLGLNREPSESELTRNRLQCELRKRTWWSLFVVERLVCAGLGRPLTITHKDCEAGFPQLEDDDNDIMDSGTLATRPMVMSNFSHLIALSKIQGNILEFIKAKSNSSASAKCPNIGSGQDRDCRVDTSAAAFSLLDKSLTEWRQSLPESLQNPTAQSPQFGLFLHLTFNTLIILLHRPEVPTSQTSASLCTQAAATICDITQILMDAKALTSMFISCLYAIFSAGIIHFMNIPSVKKSVPSSSSSPVIPDPREMHCSHTMSAKTNLKRCIDALKFLASHWVSAARRAKVLEDLLDLKHVSLKDLEVDPFKMSPVGPSWAMEASQYKAVLVGPREGQDKLRQQCRSKVMAIHSLLANDDEFKKMQRRRSSSFETNDTDDGMDSATESSARTREEDEESQSSPDMHMTLAKSSTYEPLVSSTSVSSQPPIGLGVQTPSSSVPSVSSPASIRTDNGTSQHPLDPDPGMVHSTAGLGISDSPIGNQDGTLTAVKTEGGIDAAPGLVRHENGLLTPMTMTTLVQGSTSPLVGTSGNRPETQSKATNGNSKQGAMLDPFSMPSSISFPDRDHDRRGSTNGAGNQTESPFNTVWTTDSLTQRATARSAASSPMVTLDGAQQEDRVVRSDDRKAVSSPSTSITVTQPLSLYSESSTHAFPGSGSGLVEREEQDLVWNDMPPTLGLDEWTAYIGAMMMRWLYASGQSSPRSTASL
ncbi:hypothetical protein BGZ58_011323, partial [Dissophora ornata]